MPDATRLDWLVEYADVNGKLVYERFGNVNDAIPFLHEVLSKSQRPRLYRETPITLTIDVGGEAPAKSPRRRRKKEAKEDAGAASSQAAEGGACETPSASKAPLRDESAGTKPASPVFPWTCEARFDGDPACPGFVELDPVTKGRFCGLHIQIPESHRREFHNRNASRNRPVRVAHAG